MENRSIPFSGNTNYESWEQVAGYFDGDGNVGLEIIKRVIHLRIRFVDTWKPQVEAVKSFLDARGITTGRVGKDNKTDKWPAYRLEVSAVESVVRTAKSLLRYCVKKHEDLRITIDYFEGEITGNQALFAFNYEVMTGRRRGYVREADIPHTRFEGLRLSKLENAEKARAGHAVNVPPKIQEQIKSEHEKLGVGRFDSRASMVAPNL